jgi:hypothetical protein
MRLIETTPDSRRLSARLIAQAGIGPGALLVGRGDLDELVARAALHGYDVGRAEVLGARHCRVCGCQELRACDPPCSWVEEDLCSTCAEFPEDPS